MKYQSEITSDHLETIYLVMLKRISKGFSGEALSFFIGKELSYIEQVESFELPVYSGVELGYIAHVLEESNHRSFFASVHDDTVLDIVKESHSFENKLYHSYFSIDENNEERLLFMLHETLFGELEKKKGCKENLDIAIDALDLLFRAGYFLEAKSAGEILHSINQFLTEPLDRAYIQKAIFRFSKDLENEKELSIVEAVIDGCRRYEQG